MSYSENSIQGSCLSAVLFCTPVSTGFWPECGLTRLGSDTELNREENSPFGLEDLLDCSHMTGMRCDPMRNSRDKVMCRIRRSAV